LADIIYCENFMILDFGTLLDFSYIKHDLEHTNSPLMFQSVAELTAPISNSDEPAKKLIW